MEQLTAEEKEVLHSYRTSELFRVFMKCIDLEFQKVAYQITTAPIEQLQKLQGTLQGLTISKNMIHFHAEHKPGMIIPIKK